jgi:hypothetical protein
VSPAGAIHRRIRDASGVPTLEDPETRPTGIEASQADFRQETGARFRSVDEPLAEIRALIIDGRNS